MMLLFHKSTINGINMSTYTTESEGTKKGKGGGQGASARAGEAGSAERGHRATSPSSTRPSQLRNQRHSPDGLPATQTQIPA